MWPAVQKWWQAISKKLSTHYTQGFWCNCYALELSKLCFFFFLWWTEYVLAALAAVLEWVKVKGFNTGVFRWLELETSPQTHTHVFSLSLSLSYLQRCPLPVAVSVGGRSSPGGRTGCVSFSPSVSPCSTGYAPETQDNTVKRITRQGCDIGGMSHHDLAHINPTVRITDV